MKLIERVKALAQTDGWLVEQSNLWAARHCPGSQERVAALTVRILAEQVGVGFEPLDRATRFVEDLNMVELEGVELVMALEEEFGFKIPDEEAEQIGTLGELISYLHGRVQTNVA